MVGTLIQLLILFVFPLLFVNPGIGIGLYLICFFLIPSMSLPVIGMEETETSVLFALTFILANLKNLKYTKKINYSPFVPFVALYTIFFLLTFLSAQEAPWGYTIKIFVRHIITTFIIPICIFTLICCKTSFLRWANRGVIFAIAVSIGYGLLLTMYNGENPYLDILHNEMGLPEIHLGDDSDRLFGAISSVFMHPMSFGVMIGLSCIYLIDIKKHKSISQGLSILLILVTLIASVLCGVRSSLAALMGTGCVYLLLKRKFKLFMMGGAIVAVALLVMSYIPALDTYIGSMFQMDSDNVHGSSIAQRLVQLGASIDEVQGNIYFGNGYAWHSYYIFNNDGYGHPVLHGWESLLFVAITDSGFVGVLLWIVFCIYFCIKFKDTGIICLFSYFMLFRLATGQFGEELFFYFYTLLLCYRNFGQKMHPAIIGHKK